ncbi:Metallo-dependent hydrolase [Whalleya microplaca]|nr:Metallo-dependent hydrolase [Whalleya microplaca]
MGGFHRKDRDFDRCEKNVPRRHSVTFPFRQIFDKIIKMAQSQPEFHFQKAMIEKASKEDEQANKAVLHKRSDDDEKLYGQTARTEGFDGRTRQRSACDHFSVICGLIERSSLFPLAQKLPKAAHLHIHFNSTLRPKFLLDQAKEMENMYIWSVTSSLRSKEDFDNCEIMFLLQPLDSLKDADGPNLFKDNYQPGDKMRFQYFREVWNEERTRRQKLPDSNLWTMDMECDQWLISKLVFSGEEINELFSEKNIERGTWGPPNPDSRYPEDIHLQIRNSKHEHERERARRAWKKFEVRTRMMKGLFNYQRAFKAYTRECLEEFVRDNVQYAEIRPNFMRNNQLIPDDGRNKALQDFQMLNIIIGVYEQFMEDIGDMEEDTSNVEAEEEDPDMEEAEEDKEPIKKRKVKESIQLENGKPIYDKNTGLPIPLKDGHKPSFGGLKIIWCVPRSFSKDQVAEAMARCLKMKKKAKYKNYIAGFDLVGPEAYEKEHPLKYFKEEFIKFKEDCKKENVEIPFLFHCGETPDDLEGNLECALELDSRRIGHGYALPEKADIMERMKANNVCVEACPISNMVLGLTSHMDEHRIYDLLTHEVHCTVNSDNGTLFRSTLSHDFYEVMVGNKKMNLHGWRQLAKWSIDHSCMNEVERARVLCEWDRRWREEYIPYINGDSYTEKRTKMLEGLKSVKRRSQ